MKAKTHILALATVILNVIRIVITLPFAAVTLLAHLLMWLGTIGDGLNEWTRDVSYSIHCAMNPKVWEKTIEFRERAESAESRLRCLGAVVQDRDDSQY